jgi:hypothetical protein
MKSPCFDVRDQIRTGGDGQLTSGPVRPSSHAGPPRPPAPGPRPRRCHEVTVQTVLPEKYAFVSLINLSLERSPQARGSPRPSVPAFPLSTVYQIHPRDARPAGAGHSAGRGAPLPSLAGTAECPTSNPCLPASSHSFSYFPPPTTSTHLWASFEPSQPPLSSIRISPGPLPLPTHPRPPDPLKEGPAWG